MTLSFCLITARVIQKMHGSTASINCCLTIWGWAAHHAWFWDHWRLLGTICTKAEKSVISRKWYSKAWVQDLFISLMKRKNTITMTKTWLAIQEKKEPWKYWKRNCKKLVLQSHLLDCILQTSRHLLDSMDSKQVSKNKKYFPDGKANQKNLQILWEHGLIAEPSYKKKNMTLDGWKNPLTGQIDNSTSLQYLLGQCTDFANELSALQVLGKELGMVVDATPKFHAELAGKGIKYSWGHAKGAYCRMALSERQGRNNFIWLVEKCLDPVEEPNIECVRLMAWHARSYICTYYHLAQQPNHSFLGAQAQQDVQQNNNIAQKQKLLFKERIECLSKQFQTLHCALDFGIGFLSSLITIKKEGILIILTNLQVTMACNIQVLGVHTWWCKYQMY